MTSMKVELFDASFQSLRHHNDVHLAAYAEVRGKRYSVSVTSRPGDAYFPFSYTIRGGKASRVLRYGPTLEAIVTACQAYIAAWLGGEEHAAQRLRGEGKRLITTFTSREHDVHMATRRLAEARRELAKARRDLKAFQRKHPGVLP